MHTDDRSYTENSSTPSPVPPITIEGLSFSYPSYPGLGAVHLFEDANFLLKPGETRIILGSPESGKTTLSRILAGFIPRYSGGSIEGAVRLGETDILSTPPSHLIDRIGMIFQDPDEQIFTTTCESEVAFPLESLGLNQEKMRRRIEEGLAITQLESFRERPPGSLSGGEKKKLLFTVLFALRPSYWILDESMDEMDFESTRRIFSHLCNGEYGVLLFASKILDVFAEFPLRYSILEDKKIYCEEEIGKEELIERARGLGLAYDGSGRIWEGLQASRGIPQTSGGFLPASGGIPQTSTPLLSASGLHFSYGNTSHKKTAVEGTAFSLNIENLDIYAGERVALVGPNGCGKTTLAKLLCGLLPPDAGTVRGIDSGPLETQVAYIFQNPDYQIFLPTVEDELAYGLKELGLPREEIDTRVAEASERFLLPALNVPPTMMSYGARKRLQAAVYYLLERRVYIIDEADSGLSLRDFANLVDSLAGRESALIIITHNERMGRIYSDRTLFMQQGTLIQSKDRRNPGGGEG
ncbi:MAG: ABC transporter ATP-binding protein [Sediminispirochaetaceae bacterium]